MPILTKSVQSDLVNRGKALALHVITILYKLSGSFN